MNTRLFTAAAMAVAAVFLLLLFSGCAVHFKASEVEYEGQVNHTYTFERFAWSDG